MDAGDRQHARHDLVDDRGLHGTKRFDQPSHRVPGKQLVAVATDRRLDGPGDAVGLAIHGRATSAGGLRLRMTHPGSASAGKRIDGRELFRPDLSGSILFVEHISDRRHCEHLAGRNLRLDNDVARDHHAVATVGQREVVPHRHRRHDQPQIGSHTRSHRRCPLRQECRRCSVSGGREQPQETAAQFHDDPFVGEQVIGHARAVRCRGGGPGGRHPLRIT